MAWATVLSIFAATMFICGAASALELQDKLNAADSTAAPADSSALPTFGTSARQNRYGIPASLEGSVEAGQNVYEISCAACHENAFALPATTFQGFKRRQRTGAMSGMQLSDQEIADIVVWLNRFSPKTTESDSLLASAR
jgi:mono/diheme cytochrome c family protein